MSKNIKASFIGGSISLGLFVVLLLLVNLLGLEVDFDFGTLLFLAALGGILGLAVNWIYQKRKNGRRV